MNTLLKTLLLGVALLKFCLAMAAVRAGNYPEATYFLLWVIAIFYCLDQETSPNNRPHGQGKE